MENKSQVINRYSFQPGAMSIIQMGEELIGHPSTAVNELVKNSYDADALECKVYFNYAINSVESFALIYDDGNGMDDKTLFGDWLKPSVSAKRRPDAKSDEFKRSLLGSKGIGRLAAMALGEYVTVISRKEDTKPYNWITVTRSAFKVDKLLSEINFPGSIISEYTSLFIERGYVTERAVNTNSSLLNFLTKINLDTFKKGTLIIIEKLDSAVLKLLSESFSKVKIESPDDTIESFRNTEFYRQLATLITPLTLNNSIQTEFLEKNIIKNKTTISDKKSNFSINYGTNLLPDQVGVEWQNIKPVPVQSVYDYRIYGKVTRDGTVDGFMCYNRLEGQSIAEEKFFLPTEEIIDDIENPVQQLFDDNGSDTGEYYFDIRVYDIGENDNLEKLARLAKFKTGKKFRAAFKDFQGLRISKNGFGVKPYGEEVEDWLDLSKERVQNPGQNVNTNQILGYVFFYSPENDNLEEKTNREGFLENKAFQKVKERLQSIFSELGKRRYNYRLMNGIGRAPSTIHQRPDIKNFINTLKSYDANNKILSYSEGFMKEVGTTLDNLEESLSFSERLASLGSGIELVYHEMAQPISQLRTTKSSIEIKKDKLPPELLDKFISDINSINHATDILAELRKSLQPAIGRTRKKLFKPYQTFLKVCNLYKSDMDEYNISIIVDKRLEDFEITDLEYAFWIAFLNITNNAVYWIKKSGKGGEIRLSKENTNLVLSNSGPSINDDIIEHIFNYGVTTRSEKNATGLGLAFTQSTLSKNDWEIFAENRENGPAFILKKTENE